MGASSKIFNRLMTFTVNDFPKSVEELSTFRRMLGDLKEDTVNVSAQGVIVSEKLYETLMSMGVEHFPKTVRSHMVFNGILLQVLLNKLPSYHLFYPEAA